MTDRVLIYPSLQGPVLTPAQRPEATTVDRYWRNFDVPSWANVRKGFAIAAIASGCVLLVPPEAAAISGTITESATETDVVAGGKTVVITLSGDTWVASGALFDLQRQNIINGLDSAQSEATGWNAEVRDKQGVAGVVRTSDTVVTITLDAQAAYDITATETITVTVPFTATTLGLENIIGVPTFTVTPVAAVNLGWYQPFSVPRPPLRTAEYPPTTISPWALVPLDKWHSPLSEPVRTRRLAEAHQRAATIDPWALTQPEAVHVQWFAPLAEPVRVKPQLPRALQSSATIDPQILTQAEAVHTQWLVPLSEPVRAKLGLPVGSHLVAVVPATVPAPETVTADMWLRSLSEPVRVKPRLVEAAQQAGTIDPWALTQPEAVNVQWLVSFSEPTRRKWSVPPDASVIAPTTTAAEDVTLDKWYAAYALPVWSRPALLAALQSSAVVDPAALAPPSVGARPTRKRYILPDGRRFYGTAAELRAYIAQLPPHVYATESEKAKPRRKYAKPPPLELAPDFDPPAAPYRLTPDDVSAARLRNAAERALEERIRMEARAQAEEDEAIALLLTTTI